MSEWVKCEDRAPDVGAKVLVWGSHGFNVALWGSHATKSGLFYWDSHSDYIRGVTHWMPLPPSPFG